MIQISFMALLNYNKIYLILATLVSTNLFYGFLPKPALLFIGGMLLLLSSIACGNKITKISSNFTKISFGVIFIVAITAIVGSLFFYFNYLGNIATITILFIIFLKSRGFDIKKIFSKQSSKANIPQLTYYTTAGLLIVTAYQLKSIKIIQSPWEILPDFFLPLFFVTTLVLILLLHKKIDKVALGLHFFIFFSITAFVYSLGYGFDQFIHEATQKYILISETITPKPFQYIGLYSINIFLHKLTALPIEILNKFLLPILMIFSAPIIFYTAKKSKLINHPIPTLSLLLLPLSYFIVTTPQGLANLLLLILIFCPKTKLRPILTSAILFIHPLTGIIALTYLIIQKLRFKKTVMILGIIALPLAFIFLSYKLTGGLGLNFKFFSAFQDYFKLLIFGGLKTNYNFWFDLFYLIQFLILPTIIMISIWTARRYKKTLSQYPLYLFGITTAGFFITKIFINFSYLINYEQKNYPERIFYISLLFLAPYLLFAIQKIYKQVSKENIIYKIFFILLFAFLITSNFYLTYPRHDNYQNDKGKNVTQFMLDAVYKIKQDTENDNYVVLTDQTVSAAALRIDGFKKYYKTPLGEVFYYPIPTGGPLYNEFLNLIYNETGIKSVESAKTLTGAKRAYVALPSYWENYTKIKERLKQNMQILYEDENITILK